MDSLSPLASTELSNRSIKAESLIYRTLTCSVYRGFDYSRNISVALKFLLYEISGNTEVAAREIVNQQACRHPNIVELYDYFWYYKSQTHWVGVLVMEYMMKDLHKDVTDRKEHNYHYTEEQLMDFLRVMTDTLAAAQEIGICHRDIKPQNIFLSQGVYKIGDFGSSKQPRTSVEMMTVTGTPCYLSPALRQGLTKKERSVVHNPYKSDVFSLGLTLLHMATLAPPPTLPNFEEACMMIISRLSYSDHFKNFLAWMLTFDESSRPDFFQIRKYFQKGTIAELESSEQKECEHLIAFPHQLKNQSPCGHILCNNCSSLTTSEFQNCLSMTCPICHQRFDWFFEGPQISGTPLWKGFCSKCMQQEVMESTGGLGYCRQCLAHSMMKGGSEVNVNMMMSSLRNR